MNLDDLAAALAMFPEAFPAVPEGAPHLHDFHTGNARCAVCKLTAAEAGVQGGGRVLGPRGAKDDGWRPESAGTSAMRALDGPAGPRALAPVGGLHGELEDVPLVRMDVVAHLYELVRRPGEDDASLATRIRRESVRLRTVHPVPPMAWQPPCGFRLGDDWRAPMRKPHETVIEPDEAWRCTQGFPEWGGDPPEHEMKRVN